MPAAGSLVLVVEEPGACPLLRPGDRWVFAGREVRAAGAARLCAPAVRSLEPGVRARLAMPASAARDAADAATGAVADAATRATRAVRAGAALLACTEPACAATFRWEPAEERRQADGPPPFGVERRADHLAMAAGRLLREDGPFLTRLGLAIAERLVAASTARRYHDREVILPEGAVGERLFLVDSGEVEVVRRSPRDGSERVLALLGRWECFGEMSLLTGEPTSAAVRARGEAHVLSVGREEFEALLGASPELNRAFSRLLAARLRAVVASVESELGRGILGRLSMMSAVDLVQSLSATRRTGSLVLKGRAREGRIDFEDGRVASARLGSVAGEEAFLALMGWKEGEFCFEGGPEADAAQTGEGAGGKGGADARIQADTLALLLEAMQRIDEASL